MNPTPCTTCGASVGESCQPRWIGDYHGGDGTNSAFLSRWGHTPIHWVVLACPCGVELECFDPAAGPLLRTPYCRRCALRDGRCPVCGFPPGRGIHDARCTPTFRP